MKFIIAKKLNMTSYFLKSGAVVPVTVLTAGPLTVTQVKTLEKDKYQAVQVGFGKRVLREFKVNDLAGFAPGKKIDIKDWQAGEIVNVTAVIKGRGFTGPVKRHSFAGMPASHGHDKPRAVGSIGQRFPQHVRKGLRMAGRMGGHLVTVKNLQVIDIDPAKNLVAVKGAVPGSKNGIVKIVSTGKVLALEKEQIVNKDKKK